MQPTSTKPYLIRALYEWCVDNGFTPHLMVAVDANTRVPMGYVKDGEIVLNINHSATKDLLIENEAITFSARFNGASTNIYIPMGAVKGVFSRESGQGMFFEPEPTSATENSAAPPIETDEDTPPPPPKGRPSLKVVK